MCGDAKKFYAGIRIFCSEQRSQGQNRERAMALLRSRLYEMELEKQQAEESAKRKSQVCGCYIGSAYHSFIKPVHSCQLSRVPVLSCIILQLRRACAWWA